MKKMLLLLLLAGCVPCFGQEQKLGTIERRNQNIWNKVTVKENNQVDMARMIENAINKIDVTKYLSFELIGINGTKGNNAKPCIKPLPNDRSKVSLSFGLICFFDADKFQKESMPFLKNIFDNLPFEHKIEFIHQINTRLSHFTLPPREALARPSHIRLSQQQKNILQQNGFESVASLKVSPMYNGELAVFQSLHKSGKQSMDNGGIFLNISAKYRFGSQRFIAYSYPEKPSRSLLAQTKTEGKNKRIPKLSASVCFLDGEGNEVRRITKHLTEREEQILGAGIVEIGNVIIISPEFFKSWGGSNDTCSSPILILPLTAIIDMEDYKDIKTFKLETKVETTK